MLEVVKVRDGAYCWVGEAEAFLDLEAFEVGTAGDKMREGFIIHRIIKPSKLEELKILAAVREESSPAIVRY